MGNGTSALSHILHSAEVIHAGMYVLKQDDMKLSKALVTTVQWSEECAVEGLRKCPSWKVFHMHIFLTLENSLICILCLNIFQQWSCTVPYHITAAQGTPPVPFSLWEAVLSLHGSQWLRKSVILFWATFTLYFPHSVFTVFHGP